MRMLQQVRRVFEYQAIGIQRRAIGMEVFGARLVVRALRRERRLQLLMQGSGSNHVQRVIGQRNWARSHD